MVIPYSKFYGQFLKQAFFNTKDFTEEDMILYKFLCNCFKNFPENIDEEKFDEYIKTEVELIDQVCFYILLSKLGNTLFAKDAYYISELCTILTIKNIPPQNYITYANFFLSEPIYSLIISIDANSYEHGYLSLFDIIITNFDINNLSESDYNRIIKILKKFLNKEHLILFKDSDTLEDIYIKLYKRMLDANKKSLYFSILDFTTIHSLKDYIATNDTDLIEILKRQLIDSENRAFDSINIIRECLKIIKKYNEKIIPLSLSRRKKHEKK